MSEPDEPRSRRDRPAKPPLSRAAITITALHLAERDGLGAVTLRRVAECLDTGPASLYAYVADRDDLLERMLDRVLSGVPIGPLEPSRWQPLLVELFTDLLRALCRYPGIARVALGSMTTSPGALAIVEQTVALLRCGGASEQAAAWASDALFLFTIATAVDHAMSTGAGESRAEAPELPGSDRFTFALNAIISGARDGGSPEISGRSR